MTQRSLLSYRVVDLSGYGVQDAKVFVYEVGTTTPAADLYTGMTGGSPVGFLLTDAGGSITGWVDESRYFSLKITDNADTAHYPGVTDSVLLFSNKTVVRGAFLVSDVY